MASIKPNTNAPYFVDLRKALADGRLEKSEVDKLIAPHYRQAWSDKDYYNALQDLASPKPKTTWMHMVNGKPVIEPVVVDAAARAQLAGVLCWESVPSR